MQTFLSLGNSFSASRTHGPLQHSSTRSWYIWRVKNASTRRKQMYFKQRGWILAPPGSYSPQTRYLINPSSQLLTTYISTPLHPPSISIRDKKNQSLSEAALLPVTSQSQLPGVELDFSLLTLCLLPYSLARWRGRVRQTQRCSRCSRSTYREKKKKKKGYSYTATSRKRWGSLRVSGRSRLLFTSHTSQSMHLTQELLPPLSTAKPPSSISWVKSYCMHLKWNHW